MTTFIKTEEQNYSLYNYVNMLNNEIDSISESNRVIASHIKRHEDMKRLSAKEKELVKDRLRKQIAELKTQMGQKDSQIKGIIKDLAAVKGYCRQMSEKFAHSDFHLVVANQMKYDDDTQFKENNTTSYLAELEEYIAMLITYTAYSQELPDAAVSALSLEKMIPKRDLENQAPLNVSYSITFLKFYRLMPLQATMCNSLRPMTSRLTRMMVETAVPPITHQGSKECALTEKTYTRDLRT